ncbi:diaminopimelate decarboxylase [Salinifilum aidingensis]
MHDDPRDLGAVVTGELAHPYSGRVTGETTPAEPRAPIDMSLLPRTAAVDERGRLSIGGVDVLDAAAEFGTPLFLYDAAELQHNFREAVEVFGEGVSYATKAFLTPHLARLAAQEGMSFDVSTAGEYECCRRAGVPASKLVLHGNNKQPDELVRAVEEGVQGIVVDNFDELDRIDAITREREKSANVMVRINPGIEVHTHEYVATGNRESKFGFPAWTGDADEAIGRVRAAPYAEFQGLHMHIGSFVLQLDNFLQALEAAAPLVEAHDPDVLVVGGGLGLRYLHDDECPTFREWGEAIVSWGRHRFPGTRILAEPGRAMVARAGITLYTAGVVQQKGDLTFVAVDGGMSDNPRPVLYGSGYEVFHAGAPLARRERSVRVVGRHCESGDTLLEHGHLPGATGVGDIICTPVTGAYGYSMSSNYNLVPRAAVVFAAGGEARLTTRRETLDDLFAREVG